MDDGSPTLEVGFAIDTGGSFDSLAQLQSVMDSAEAKIVADAKNIEAATGRMLNLGSATAQVSAFGSAATRELATAARATASAEKAGEALSRQMERQISTFGMSRAASAALRAEQNGLTELAERLRTQEASLIAMRDQAAAATRREAEAAQRLAMAHADLAAKVQASHAAQLADADAAERMRMATDPLYAATSRLNAEIAESTRLYYAGATAPAEYARQQQVLSERLREVERQHNAVNRGLVTVGTTGKLTGFHMQNMAFQFQDLGMQMAMAAQSSRPFSMAMTALFQQGTQINGIMSQAGVGIGAVARQLLATIAPFTAVIAVAGLLGAALLGIKQAAASDDEMKRFAGTLGLTKDEMEKLKDVTVTWGDTFGATMEVLLERAGFTTEQISSFFGTMWGKIGEFGKFSVAILLGGFAGLVKGAYSLFANLAGIVGNAFVGAANFALEAIEGLVNKAIDGANAAAGAFNSVFGTKIGGIAHVSLGRVNAEFKGSMGAIGKDASDALHGTFEGVMKGFEDIAGRATDRAQARVRKQAKDIIDDRTPKKGRESKAGEALAREMAATEALIKGNYDLAAAYQVSDAAAFEAEIRAKATAAAIKKQADVEAYVAQQMRLAVSQRAVDGGKAIAELAAQTAAQRQVNDSVAAGTITSDAAQNALRAEAQLRPLLVAQTVAEGDAKVALTGIINRLRSEQAAANAEANRAKVLADTASGQDKLEQLRLEAKLISATNAERARAIALLAAEQFLRANPGATPAEAEAYARTLTDIAVQTEANATAQNNYNASLSYARDLFAAIGDQASTLGGILSSAFGGFGDSIGGLISTLTDLQTQQQSIADWRRDEIKKAGGDATRLSQIEVLAAKASQSAQMKATSQALAGVKSLFKEKSTAFKVISAIEKAYAVWQAAEAIASMVRDTTKTVSAIANSTARATAAGAEGVANQSKLPFPYNIAAMAATAAALVAAGIAILGSGGGGGSSGPSVPTSEDLQAGAGTGTVLGDMKAKSDSIARSLELVAANTNRDLEYSNAMLKALRNIDMGIAKMAGTIARQISVSGSLFDTSGQNLGVSSKKGFLGVFGGSTTTRTLFDLGVQFGAATVGSIIDGGISGQSYQIIEKIKKKKGFLGIGSSTKTTYETTLGVIDPDITNAIQAVIGSLRDGLVEASKVIGLQGAAAMLDGFQISLGTISFKDMTGEEIEQQMNAVFSSIGDQMAGKLFPALSTMQIVGEGLFETFIRVAKEYQAVDIALRSIGRTFGMIGIQSIQARDHLVQLFGGLEEFLEGTDFFRDQFLTEAEQIAPITASVKAEFERLGVFGLVTRDRFKQLVLSLDLTTQAGREMYAALLAVAPAFDKVLDYTEQLRRAEVEGYQRTIEQFGKLAESLKKYRETLLTTGVSQEASLAILRQRFADTVTLAANGNADALGNLEGAGKAFLDSALANAGTALEYQRAVALVMAGVDKGIFAAEETVDYAKLQLEALDRIAGILSDIANLPLSGPVGVLTAHTPPTTTPGTAPVPITVVPGSSPLVAPAADVGALRQEIEDLRMDLNAGLLAIATNTSKTARLQERWDGDGLVIRTDPADPIQSQVVP